MRPIVKRAGVAALAFFVIKGFVWLAVIAGAAVWAGGDRAAGPGETRAKPAVAARSAGERPGAVDGVTGTLPMGLGSALQAAARACGR